MNAGTPSPAVGKVYYIATAGRPERLTCASDGTPQWLPAAPTNWTQVFSLLPPHVLRELDHAAATATALDELPHTARCIMTTHPAATLTTAQHAVVLAHSPTGLRFSTAATTPPDTWVWLDTSTASRDAAGQHALRAACLLSGGALSREGSHTVHRTDAVPDTWTLTPARPVYPGAGVATSLGEKNAAGAGLWRAPQHTPLFQDTTCVALVSVPATVALAAMCTFIVACTERRRRRRRPAVTSAP